MEDKIRNIINKFDLRMEKAVISYIIDKGWTLVASITDEQIDKLTGNEVMTRGFQIALVKAAREICRICDMFNDFLPYIQNMTNLYEYIICGSTRGIVRAESSWSAEEKVVDYYLEHFLIEADEEEEGVAITRLDPMTDSDDIYTIEW